jgi:hypothetical protein
LNARAHFNDIDIVFFAIVKDEVLAILDKDEVLTALSEEHDHISVLVISS